MIRLRLFALALAALLVPSSAVAQEVPSPLRPVASMCPLEGAPIRELLRPWKYRSIGEPDLADLQVAAIAGALGEPWIANWAQGWASPSSSFYLLCWEYRYLGGRPSQMRLRACLVDSCGTRRWSGDLDLAAPPVLSDQGVSVFPTLADSTSGSRGLEFRDASGETLGSWSPPESYGVGARWFLPNQDELVLLANSPERPARLLLVTSTGQEIWHVDLDDMYVIGIHVSPGSTIVAYGVANRVAGDESEAQYDVRVFSPSGECRAHIRGVLETAPRLCGVQNVGGVLVDEEAGVIFFRHVPVVAYDLRNGVILDPPPIAPLDRAARCSDWRRAQTAFGLRFGILGK